MRELVVPIMIFLIEAWACGSYHDFLDRWFLLTRKLLNQMFLLVQLKPSLSFTVMISTMTWLVCVINDHGYVPYVVSIYRCFPLSSLVARFDARVTQRVPQMKQELPTLPEQLSPPPVFSGIRVARSLAFCVMYIVVYPFRLPPSTGD